jgi:hypothetical protein
MRRPIQRWLFLAALSLCPRLGAQANSFPATGSVGIGTTTPVTTLEVVGDVTAHADVSGQPFRALGRTSDNFAWAPIAYTGSGAAFTGGMAYTPSGVVLAVGSSLTNVMSWLPTGYVGIGTTSPSTDLAIVSAASEYGVNTDQLSIKGGHGGGTAYAGVRFAMNETTTGWGSDIEGFDDTDYYGGAMIFRTGGGSPTATPTERLRIASSGNVGIGTTNPTNLLSVNGTVQAKEVLVNTGWSDYVFAKGYHLSPLSEVERAITSLGHLPGVPSAVDVQEKGVKLGQMESVLLAKIEELTLHQIEQEKRISALEARNAVLEKQATEAGQVNR